MRFPLLLALLVLLPECATPDRRPLPPPGAFDLAALAKKAEDAEAEMGATFLSPEGLVVYKRFPNGRQNVHTGPYGDLSDTACWGGYYVGAEAMRLAVTGDARAKTRLSKALGGLELLERVTGRPGLLARSADRNVKPSAVRNRGGWREGAIPGYAFNADVSKDQYAGVLFGLGCVLRYVHDPAIRARAAGLAIRIATRIDAHGGNIAGPDGRVTTYGDLSQRYLGFPLAANAALKLLAYRLSALAGGPPSLGRRYRRLVEEGYAHSASFAKVEIFGKTNRNNDHMATACLYHLAGLEKDPTVRRLYVDGLARVASGVRGEDNSLFLGEYMAVTHASPDLVAEALYGLTLLPIVKTTHVMDLRSEIQGVVPMNSRPATSFVWRSDPYDSTWGLSGRRKTETFAPVDYLVAYWLLRMNGLLGNMDEG